MFEVLVPVGRSGSTDGLLGAAAGVVDVIDLNAADRAKLTSTNALREGLAGGGLLLLGCVVFVSAAITTTQAAGRECRDEIGVRVLLGAEAEGLWGPLGLVVGGVALAGALLSFSAAALLVLAGPGEAAFPGWWMLAAVVALLVGTLGLAFGAARRVVAEAARATVLAGFACLLVFVPAPRATALGPPDLEARTQQPGPARDAVLLRALSRDLAVCRRTLHVARKGLATTELQAVVASAHDDEVLLRIASAKRAEDLVALGGAEERCAALAEERLRLREVLRSTRLLGPAIGPRQAPVQGTVVVRYGQAGRKPGTAGFRNGVALRTRRGESVRASAPGRVAYSGQLPGSGSVVVIDHGRRTYSVYAKIGPSRVRVGQEVDAGETVARAGTGLLYFSVRHRGRAVDPLDWVAGAPKS